MIYARYRFFFPVQFSSLFFNGKKKKKKGTRPPGQEYKVIKIFEYILFFSLYTCIIDKCA